MNERDALKTITILLNDELKSLERMFVMEDRPSLFELEVGKVKNAISYASVKTVELNEKEYPLGMAPQPETPFVSDY